MGNIKKYTNRKWLENQYLKSRSISQIANACGVALTTISRWLEFYKIRQIRKSKANRAGPRNSYWNGGRYVDRLNGYVHIYKPNHPFAKKRGYVLEHRLVMEKSLGRYLRKNEIVHHRNKVKTDNRIENLELIILGEVNGGDVQCPHCNKIFKIS